MTLDLSEKRQGPATTTFTFTNTGTSPIKLTYVKASCGCTTPSWTKEAVAPGATGYVKVSYNPAHRPGSFRKSITIRTDGDPQAMILRISGVVTPKPKGLEDRFLHKRGNLRFTDGLALGDIDRESKKTIQLKAFNTSGKPIQLDLAKSRIPDFITITSSSPTVPPQDSVELTMTFDAKAKNDWGFVYGGIYLATDDADKPDKRLTYTANLQEDFSKQPKDALLPTIKLDNTRHDFGKVKQNDKASHSFKLTNEGKGKLMIRKISTSCGCTVADLPKMEIQPNESIDLNVFFSSGKRRGIQKKSITIITNDPNNRSIVLWINAEVTVEE